jgi:ABC-2 type transport system ATP-binding protein
MTATIATHDADCAAGRGSRAGRNLGSVGADRLISVEGLSKDFGPVRAVDGISFQARPARVTGFIGPNGAGKSTTLRMILGLVRPTGGRAMIAGRSYRELHQPMRLVGAALDNACFHPGRSGRDHLRTLAPYAGVDEHRVDEALSLVGLSGAARRLVGAYSLGMRQRLGLAAAMLADPPILILDEPTNGLDPQGIVWLRQILRDLASQGRTILFSSHALGEVEQIVDDVVIVAGGRVVHASSLNELAGRTTSAVRIFTPTPKRLERVARLHGWAYTRGPQRGRIELHGVEPSRIGRAARLARVEIHEMVAGGNTLEDVFLSMVDAGATAVGSRTAHPNVLASSAKEASDEERLVG